MAKLDTVFFSDEAKVHLVGWGSENPHILVETGLQPGI